MTRNRRSAAVLPFALLSGFLVFACSDHANTSVSGHSLSLPLGTRLTALTPPPNVPPLPPGLVSDDAGAAAPALPFAVGINAPPWSICTVYPEGNSGDSAHTDYVMAAPDGIARFYPPPPDWGSKFTVACTLNGNLQGQFSVHLDDTSTFSKLSGPDLEARKTGVRPALTGDLSAISADSLSQGGYPPRPDSAAFPQKYANWVQKVNQPLDIYSAVGIARLGHHGVGAYEGTIPPSTNNQPWSGFVQSGSGFANSNTANFGTYYQEYEFDTFAPPAASCSGNCNTLLWAGIGGFNTNTFIGRVSGGLVQSGFDITGNGVGNVQLYWNIFLPGAHRNFFRLGECA
jgi:hypothetical protein